MRRSEPFGKRVVRGAIIAGALLCLAVPALAKGSFAQLTVTGGALESQLVITDPALLGFMAFSDFSKGDIPQPTGLGPEYTITRYGQDQSGKYVADDSLRYYPSPDGGQGYVYYDGLINGRSEYDDRWYPADPDAEARLRPLITQPSTPQFDGSQPAALGMIALAAGIGLAGWLNKRRQIASPPQSPAS